MEQIILIASVVVIVVSGFAGVYYAWRTYRTITRRWK